MSGDLKNQIMNLPELGGNVAGQAEAIEEVMRDMGFNRTQIFLFTVATCVVFAAFVSFVLLGCSLFITPNNLLPTLISSGAVILPAATILRSGELPPNYAQTNHKLMGSVNTRMAEWNGCAAKVKEVAAAEDAEAAIKAADKL